MAAAPRWLGVGYGSSARKRALPKLVDYFCWRFPCGRPTGDGVFCAAASLYFAYPRQPGAFSVFAPVASRSLADAFLAAVAATVVAFLLGWWP